MKKKCVIILSEKSSGSSACLNFLCQETTLRAVAHTRHYENETLYWVKAASLLGLPQENMIDSEVPIPRKQARRDLEALIRDNTSGYTLPQDDEALVHDGWRALCEAHAPCFLEKSPHHLCQWSALELIAATMERNRDVDFLLIGLVRNPMDTIYSQFDRWRHTPSAMEKQWLTAYRNLQRLEALVGPERIVKLRYEDMVRDPQQHLRRVFEFCGVTNPQIDTAYLHTDSLQRWKDKSWFGFCLSEEAMNFAEDLGYERSHMENTPASVWPYTQPALRLQYKLIYPLKKLYRRVKYPEKRRSLFGR
ncbi:sulfotransferase [Granulosicoccaceae sp. 1_MG-2023]|nr:sulfotransferase [Granulosicoccaceae sp. 1_MG-2023]